MWNEPDRVDRIAMKSSAKLIVDPAFCHLPRRKLHHLKCIFISCPVPVTKQKLERHRWRKLWRTAKAAVGLVKRSLKTLKRTVKLVDAETTRGSFGSPDSPQLAGDLIRGMQKLNAAFTPRLGDTHEDLLP